MSVKAIPPHRSRHFLLHLLNRSTTLSHLTQIHTQLLLTPSLQNDVALTTKLTHRLFDFSSTRHARSLFLSFPYPDLFLFNVLLKGLSSSSSSPLSAVSLFNEFRRSNPLLCPDGYSFALLVSAAADLEGPGGARMGMAVHGMVVVNGFGSDLFVGSGLVGFYFKNYQVGCARKVFDEMPERDIVLINTMVSGFARNSRFEESVRLFGDVVLGSGPGIDVKTVAAVLPAVAELVELSLGKEIHCLGVKFGFCSHVSVLTGLVSLYSKCGVVVMAELVFNEISRKDLIACNAMISGYSCNGETESSVRLFRELLVSGIEVSSSTVVGLIPVHSPFGHLSLTDSIHGMCLKCGIILHSSVSTAFITVYSRLNEIELAKKIFDGSSDRSVPSWNALIAGCSQNGQTEMALALFLEMQESNIDPNPTTVTVILSACAQLGASSLGKWVHSLVRSKQIESNVYILTALIDMYAKCGSIEEARKLFDLMPEKNEVTWNAMISGYGLHGRGREALNLYNALSNSGIIPNGIAFLSVLHACSHAGLVKEGEEIFHSMVHKYRIEPSAEHYACMVDILGRAGQLQKALDFIKAIPFDPGPSVWSTLLGACMIHKDRNIARVASERLLELDPENMGHYVSLSNIYSAERNYPQAASVRQVAKQRKLAKTPGYTLIEVGQIPHVFKSGDQSHPQSNEIYAELERLKGKMQEVGFRAETNAALHDVEEEEKELMVKVHSEKLAIAFGLISTDPGTEIRIIKNLRVCLDCHTFSKYISKVTQRVLVVRDANRFHHFKDGMCSCGDYW